MAHKVCCFPGCNKARTDNVVLHTFPNPDTEADRFKTWLDVIGGEILSLDHEKIAKYRKVCDRHFELKYHTRSKRLSANAVPVLQVQEIKKVPDIIEVSDHQHDEDLISINDNAEGEEALFIPDTFKLEPTSEDERTTEPPNIPYTPIIKDLQNRRGGNPDDATMRDVKACRACLNNKGLLVKINETHRRIFQSACGIIVSPTDGYPYYFCVECSAQIKKILAFRRKARRAEFVLKEIMTVRNEVSSADIATVDRKVTNLVSSLKIWNPQNIYLYTYDQSNEEYNNQLLKEPVKYRKGTIRIQCSEHDINDDLEDTNEFDDGIEDTVGDNAFDSVDDIIQKLGVDDTDVDPEDIDLNDVFKGLKEIESDDDSMTIDAILKPEDMEKLNAVKEYDEMVKLKNEEKIKKETKRQRIFKKYLEKSKLKEEQNVRKLEDMTYKSVALVLYNFTIEILSIEEQIKYHEGKWKCDPFKSSLYKCTICIKVFETVQNLIDHCKEHNQKGKVSCPVCRLQLEDEEDKEIHVAERHRYKYTCNLCGHKAYELSLTVQHKCPNKPSLTYKDAETESEISDMFQLIPQTQEDMRKTLETNTGPYRCPICKMAFASAVIYKLHYNKHDKGNSDVQCDICGVYYKSLFALSRHMYDWHQYTYHCKRCNFEATQKNIALKHLKNHKALDKGCPYCPTVSRSDNGLQTHIHKWHYKEVYNKICPLCGNGFRSQVSLYSHQLEIHKYFYLPHPPQEPNELTCVHCNIEFKSKRAFDTHVLSFEHEEANDIPYTCRPCRKIFEDEESRNAHVFRCPQNFIFPMPCSLCGVTINSGVDYHYHYNKYHPTYIAYRNGKLCEECGRVVTRKRWSSHFCRIKNKPYQCTICDKKLVTSRSYGLHMIYKHTDRPFHCALCPERFKRRIKAKRHIFKSHTPALTYACPACPSQFPTMKFLNEHALSIHGIDLKDDETYKMGTSKYSIYIYPDMKLNVSKIDKNKLKEVELQVRDYNNKVIETINKKDYDKYLIFDVKPEEKPEKKRRGRKRKVSELPVKPKKKRTAKTEVTESDFLIDDTLTEFILPDKAPKKRRGRRKKYEDDENVKNEEVVDNVIIESGEGLELMDAEKEEVVETVIIETEESYEPVNEKKEEIIETVIIESGDGLEITEVDGKKYVTINGVLYYLENQ